MDNNTPLTMDKTVNLMLEKSTAQHEKISGMQTPKAYIKKKAGMDYVELAYMKSMADKHFPGWSWQVVNTEFAGTEAYIVHGRLAFIDNGIRRTGDMTAAHRIQRNDKGYVDIGNDIKAANTDCMKKAFNTYMNIADDVYRKQAKHLTDQEVIAFVQICEDANLPEDKIDEIMVKVRNGKIHKYNYKEAIERVSEISPLNKEKETK